MDIVLIKVSSRIDRMSKRRQKKAIAKLPKTVLKDCYPVNTGHTVDDGSGDIVVNMTFEFENARKTDDFSFTWVEKYVKV